MQILFDTFLCENFVMFFLLGKLLWLVLWLTLLGEKRRDNVNIDFCVRHPYFRRKYTNVTYHFHVQRKYGWQIANYVRPKCEGWNTQNQTIRIVRHENLFKVTTFCLTLQTLRVVTFYWNHEKFLCILSKQAELNYEITLRPLK